MGADDDADCVHVWGISEVVVSSRGADRVQRCDVCDAVRYDPGQAALRDVRPPL